MSETTTTIYTPTREELSAKCWELRQALDDAKRVRWSLTDAELRHIADVYVLACYEWQRVVHGKVKRRLPLAGLLR